MHWLFAHKLKRWQNGNKYRVFGTKLANKGMHGMFLEWWNRTKSLSSIWQHFSCLLDEGIPKIWKKLNSHDGFLSYLLIGQPIQPIWQHIFALLWSALKKPPWEFNFVHIFGIPSSSRHEKCCQMLQTLFWLFQCSKNPRCEGTTKLW